MTTLSQRLRARRYRGISFGERPDLIQSSIPDFTVVAVFAHLHTIEFFIGYPLEKGYLSQLRARYGSDVIIDLWTQGRWLYKITAHRPDRWLLGWLSERPPTSFLIIRADTAVDMFFRTIGEIELAETYFRAQVRQKWHGERDTNLHEHTQYWSKNANVPRSIALYGDKRSDANGEPCLHLELRFRGAETCRKRGFDQPATFLTGIDVIPLLRREARVVVINPRKVDNTLREWAQELRQTHAAYRHLDYPDARGKLQRWCEMWLYAKGSGGRCVVWAANAQDVWDHLPRLRSSLDRGRDWSDLIPTPQWVVKDRE